MKQLFFLLAFVSVLCAGGVEVRAQCLGTNGRNTIDTCPQAVTPVQNDEVLVYQPGQTPHMRKLTIGQLFGTLGFTPLSPAKNLSDLSNAAIARSNLGLGGAATYEPSALPLSSTQIANGLGFTPLNPANSLSEISNQAAARGNLGLGSIATYAAGSEPLGSTQITTGLGFTPLRPSNNLSELADPVAARANLGIQANGTTSTGLMPTWTTPGTVSGNIAYNTATGRFDFVEGGAAKNYVRLNGDTMTGALALSGSGTALSVTNAASLGSVTVNPSGTNPWTIGGTTLQVAGTGNPAVFIKAANSGSLNFQTGTGGTALTVSATGISVPSAMTTTINGILDSKTITKTTGTRTYVSGSAVGQTGPNYAVSWLDNTLTGTVDTGSSVPFYNRVTDTVVLNTGATANNLPIMTYDQELNTGFDGGRWGFYILQRKNAGSVSGGAMMNTFPLFASWTGSEGGTGGASTGNWLGGGTLFNPDVTCDLPFGQLCRGLELDIRARQQVGFKNAMIINYGITDATHGFFEDADLMFTASPTVGPGTGRGLNLIQVGSYSTAYPLDPSAANTGAGTALFRVVMNTAGNQASLGAVGAAYTDTGYGVDLRPVNFTTAAFASSGFRVGPTGALAIGPGAIGYDTSGLTISASNVTAQSATVTTAGSGFNNGDYVMNPTTGSIWSVGTVGGASNAAASTLTLVKPGFSAACSGAGTPLTGGYGKGLVATITCSSAATTLALQPSGGATTVGGTLGVTGATTLSGGGTFTGTFAGAHTYSGAVTLSSAGTALNVANNATVNGSLTAGTNGADAILFKDTVGTGPRIITSGNNLQLKTAISGGGTAIVATVPSQIASSSAANISLAKTTTTNLQYGTSTTYTAGSGIGGATATNPAQMWNNVTLSGSITTGAGTPYFWQVADNIAMSSANSMFNFSDSLGVGNDGNRSTMVLIFNKTAAAATPTGTGGGWGYANMNMFMHVDHGDGGTSAGPLGGYTNFNPDIRCNTGDWIVGCSNDEHDIRLYAGTSTPAKQNLILHYGIGDAAHAAGTTARPNDALDVALTIDASPTIGNGSGKGLTMIGLGNFGQDIPWDTSAGIGTYLMRVYPNDSGNLALAGQAYIDNGFYLPEMMVRNDFLNNGNFRVSGIGDITSGLAKLTATPSGAQLDVTGVVEQSATVISGGNVSKVGQEIVDSAGGIWETATVSGTGGSAAAATVTLKRAAAVATCPSSPATATGFNSSSAITLNITCSSARNTLALQPSGGATTVGGALSVTGTATAASYLPTPTVVASLGTCNSGAKGTIKAVTDALSPTWNATVAGGGAVSVPVYCNGTNWTVH